MRSLILLLLVLCFPKTYLFAQNALVNSNSSWKYFDTGAAPIGWNLNTFNDIGWSNGNAELGYGDGDEATVVNFGSSSSNKHITTYFRKEFSVVNPSQIGYLTLNLVRDDGAVVFVNGVEVWRSNMPGGTIGFNTLSDETIAWPSEDDWHSLNISSSYLISGNNLVAVEIHQDSPSSSDISFNFSMIAQPSLNVLISRGPYLQKATQNSVILRWRTDVACDSRVNFGLTSANLNNNVTIPDFVTDHAVELFGMDPNTIYYYGIGTGNTVLTSGVNNFFETLPVSGADGVYKFAVLGDAGTGYQEQLDAKNALLTYTGSNHFNGVILLGDNAYQSGFDSEYQDNFFGNKYNEIFENTVIWPAPGNHDYNNHIPFSPSPAYYDIFNCPTNGECGGVPSGTEKYYSFNYGNIHFISLDSYDEPRSVSGAMATWLEQDLSVNIMPWIVVYFHHPPYTKGSHDSDNSFFLDGELVDMRENIVPILENYGVDLVLNGHSHSYERSMLIDGHYGNASSFNSTQTVDSGSGSYPQNCPYQKNTVVGNAHLGTVYTVIGCSGKTSSVQSDWPHPIMHSYTHEKVGTMVLTVEKNRMDAVFITSLGEEFDKFSIVKNAGLDTTIYTCINEEITLNASWPEDVVWTPSNQIGNSFTITPLTAATVIGADPLNCIEDKFHIVLLENEDCISSAENESIENPIFSNVFIQKGQLKLEFNKSVDLDIELYSVEGLLVKRFRAGSPNHIENIENLSHGIYFLKPTQSNLIFKLVHHD